MPSAFTRIGSRGSPLALAQARAVRDRMAVAHNVAPDAIEIRVIRTSGDAIQDRPLAEVGGKGLFTKEIEEALLRNEVDLAVHSAKDMATQLPPGLAIAACLPREDPRDTFVSRVARTLAELPPGARVGTGSLRRTALLRRLRNDLVIVPMRGNVETRLRKLGEGEADATILALAGLRRLGLEDAATMILDVEAFPPAVGQGVIAIETRADDDQRPCTGRSHQRRGRCDRAFGRARVSRGARRLLQDADCRPCATCRRNAVFRPDRETRRQRGVCGLARRVRSLTPPCSVPMRAASFGPRPVPISLSCREAPRHPSAADGARTAAALARARARTRTGATAAHRRRSRPPSVEVPGMASS